MKITFCVVPGCPGRRGHTFPVNPVRQEKWLRALNWKRAEKPHRSAFVCYKHFKKSDYKHPKEDRKASDETVRRRLRLRKTAVPSLFLPNGSPTNSNQDVNRLGSVIELGVEKRSPLPDGSCTIGELTIALEDGITENEVNASIKNALDVGSPVDGDDGPSEFADIIHSTLFDDSEERRSIFLPTAEGTLEITNELTSGYLQDYDLEDDKNGFVSISSYLAGFADDADDEDLSDITFPVEIKTIHSETGLVDSVCSEPPSEPLPNVTNVIVFDANEEGVSSMKSLLLAQMKADQTIPPSPARPTDDRPCVVIHFESQDERLEPKGQTEFITEGIQDLKLTPDTSAAPDTPSIVDTPATAEPPYTQISNTKNLITEIRKTLPKVLVNRRKVLVIKKRSGAADVIRNNSSVTHEKGELSFIKSFARKRPQLKRLQSRVGDHKKKDESTYFFIVGEKRDDGVRSEEKESLLNGHSSPPNVASCGEVTISRVLPADKSPGKTNEISTNIENSPIRTEYETSIQDDDVSLNGHISLSSESGISNSDSRHADSEDQESCRRSNPTDIAESQLNSSNPGVVTGGLLTIDLDSDEETRVEGRAEPMVTPSEVDTDFRASESSSKQCNLHLINPDVDSRNRAEKSTEMLNCIVVPPTMGNGVQTNDGALTNHSENGSTLGASHVPPQTDHNISDRAIVVSKDTNNDYFVVDLAKAEFILDDVQNGDACDGSGLPELGGSDVRGSVCLDRVEQNLSSNVDMNPKEISDTGRESPCSNSGGVDVGYTVTILDDPTRQEINNSVRDGRHDVLMNDSECIYAIDQCQIDEECRAQFVQDDCLQFEVVRNDSEIMLDDILSETHYSDRRIEVSSNVVPDFCMRQNSATVPDERLKAPCTVPNHMLEALVMRGRPPTKRPPPLIIPDHDYTRGLHPIGHHKKRNKKPRKIKNLKTKPCFVALERLSSSVLARYDSRGNMDNDVVESDCPSPSTPPPGADVLICFHCSMVFTSRQCLCDHITNDHTDNMFLCPHCGARFNSVLECNNHTGICDNIVESRSPHITYLCPQCDFSTKDDSALRGHIDVEHRVQCNHSCPICPFKCVSEPALQSHVKRYHPHNTNALCSSMVQPFSSVDNQSRATAIYNHPNGDQPEISVERTNVENELEWNHPCLVCDFNCMSAESLQNHIKRYHNNESTSVVQSSTSVCPEPVHLTTQIQLPATEAASSADPTNVEHEVQPSYPCPICPFKRKSEQALLNHIKRCHPHSIYAVSGSVESSATAQTHQLTSSDQQPIEKPVKCPKCPFKSESELVLREHINYYHPKLAVPEPPVQSGPSISPNQIHQSARSMQHSESWAQQPCKVVKPPESQYQVSKSSAQPPSKLVCPIRIAVPPKENLVLQSFDLPQPILLQPPGLVRIKPQNFVQPLGSKMQQPLKFQPGCTVRQPRAPGTDQQQNITRVKCIFPSSRPKDQFVPLVAASKPAPAPPPTPKASPETDVDATDSVEGGIICPECNEPKASYGDLGRHIVECHQNKHKYHCHICPKSCATTHGLKKHISFAHGSILCPEGCSYIPRNAIVNHMVVVHRSQCFVCHCDFITTVDSVMQLHKMVMHRILNQNRQPNSGNLSCPVCPIHTTKFHHLNDLITHANQRHYFLFKKQPDKRK